MYYPRDEVYKSDFEKEMNSAAEEAMDAALERAVDRPDFHDMFLYSIPCCPVLKKDRIDLGDFLAVADLYKSPLVIACDDEPETALMKAFEQGYDRLYLVVNSLSDMEDTDGGNHDPAFEDIFYELGVFKRNCIAVVLPAFNQEENVEMTFRSLNNRFKNFSDYNFTIYSIDDGSTDKTSEEIARCAEKFGLIINHHKNEKKRGCSKTLMEAYNRIIAHKNSGATSIGLRDYFNYILRTNFDCSHRLEEVIDTFINNLPVLDGVRTSCLILSKDPRNQLYEIESLNIVMENIRTCSDCKGRNINPDVFLPHDYRDSDYLEFV